jgi:hypothetical protein
VTVEILGRHKRRREKNFWHDSNPALESYPLQESKETQPQTQCAGQGKNKTLSQKQSPSVASAFSSSPYCLPKDPLLMYISAVSRPNNVLEVQVTEKPSSLIPPSVAIMMREIPGAL